MVGETIGKYRVEARLGRGGMGTVYRAVDQNLCRDVAIKVLNAGLDDPEVARRFRAEAVTVARLNHPGIATVFELFEHDGQWLMVMELVGGETLEHLVERTGPQPVDRAVELCTQALTALAHAHGQGVVHRDLKLPNLMLTESGSLKIMDFGIARVVGSEHLTNVGFMMGTPAYMAPEQVMGREVDARADLYAMGVVLYRLVTAKLPFKGDTPFALAQSQVHDEPTPVRVARAGLPAWLEDVVARSLAKQPGDRYQTALEFRDVLQRAGAGLPTETAVFDPAGAPTVAMHTPINQAAPPTSGGTTAETVMNTPVLQTQAPTVPSAVSQSDAAQPAASPQAVPAPLAAPKVVSAVKVAAAGRGRMIAIAVGAVVVLGVAGRMMSRKAVVPPTAPAAASSAPTVTASSGPSLTSPALPPAPVPSTPLAPEKKAAPAPQAAPVLPSGKAPVTQPPAPIVGKNAAPGAPAAAGVATAPTVATTDAARGARRGAAKGVDAASDTLMQFNGAKWLVFDGRKGRDRDVILHFGSGNITISPTEGGAALVSLPYAKVLHATYTHAKDPKWDDTLPGLPDKADIPGFLRGARHWLVLQTKTDYVVLFLNDENVRRVLMTFETRTGLKVVTPTSVP